MIMRMIQATLSVKEARPMLDRGLTRNTDTSSYENEYDRDLLGTLCLEVSAWSLGPCHTMASSKTWGNDIDNCAR